MIRGNQLFLVSVLGCSQNSSASNRCHAMNSLRAALGLGGGCRGGLCTIRNIRQEIAQTRFQLTGNSLTIVVDGRAVRLNLRGRI